MRRGIVLAVLLVLAFALPAGALSTGDKRTARIRVYNSWLDCLDDQGVSFSDVQRSKVRSTSASETGRPIDSAKHKPVIVTLPTGERWIVQLKPGLKGAAAFGPAATALLDRAAAHGLAC